MKSAPLVPPMLIGRISTSPFSCSTGFRTTPISLPSATLPVMISSSDSPSVADVGGEAEFARHVAVDGQRAEVGRARQRRRGQGQRRRTDDEVVAGVDLAIVHFDGEVVAGDEVVIAAGNADHAALDPERVFAATEVDGVAVHDDVAGAEHLAIGQFWPFSNRSSPSPNRMSPTIVPPLTT